MISLKGLREKTRAKFSEYIRKRAGGVCYTCGVKKHWKEMHAGHFYHRDALDFDPRGNQCQCPQCNVFKRGNLAVYAANLVAQYGPGILDELLVLGNKVRQFKRAELEELYEHYDKVIKRSLDHRDENRGEK